MKRTSATILALLFIGLPFSSLLWAQTEARPAQSSEHATFDYFFHRAIQLRQQQRYDEALDLLLKCYLADSENSALLYEFSLLYAACSNEQKAFEFLERAAQNAPNNVFFQEKLMGYYIYLKDYGKAIELCLKLTAINPNEDSYIYTLAHLYENIKQYKESLKQLSKLEKMTGVQDAVSFEKIKLFFSINKKSKAIKEVEKLINHFPGETKYTTMLGDLTLETGNEKKALSIYHSILKKNPQDGQTLLSLSDYYRRKNETEKSDSIITRVLRNKEIPLDIKLDVLEQNVGQMIHNNSNKEEIEKTFAILLDLYSHDENVQLYYINYLLYRQENEKAFAQIKTLLDINPNREELWQKLMELKGNDFDAVLDISLQALKYFPENPYFHYSQAIAYQSKNRLNDALASIGKAIEHQPDENRSALSVFWGMKGDLLHAVLQNEKAYSAYEKALEFNAGNTMVLNNYAYFLAMENKDLRKAERMSGKAVEAEPANPTFLDTYAWVFFMRGEYTLAKFYIERAIAQDNAQNSEIFLHYGDILEKLGDTKGAVDAWEKAKEIGNATDESNQKITVKKTTEHE